MPDNKRSHARSPDDARWVHTHPFIGSLKNYYLSNSDIDTIRLVLPDFQIGQHPWMEIRAFLIARCGITRDEIRITSVGELLVMVRAMLESKSVARPTEADAPTIISAAVAEDRYHVNAETIGEAVRDVELTDYRPAGHVRNAPHRVDEREVANRWPKRTVPK